MNKVILVGNLGGNPENKSFKNKEDNEISKATFSMATRGEGKDEDSTWHNIEVYGKTADNVLNFLKKGSTVAIEGSYKNERWEQEGQKRSRYYVLGNRIEFLDKKES